MKRNQFSGCQSPGSDLTENPMIRRGKPKDDVRFREHRKCLGLTVLARRGDTFRQAQVPLATSTLAAQLLL